jgi:hypothetical protein
MSVYGQPVPTRQGPAQGWYRRVDWRHRLQAQHVLAPGQQVSVDHVGLVVRRDRFAQPGGAPVLHQGEVATGISYGVAQGNPRTSRRLGDLH